MLNGLIEQNFRQFKTSMGWYPPTGLNPRQA